MSLYKSFIFDARKYILLIEKMYVLSCLQRLEQRYTMIFTSPTVRRIQNICRKLSNLNVCLKGTIYHKYCVN